MFLVQLLVDMFRRPFAYFGLTMVALSFMMGGEAVANYHTMAFRMREDYLFFAMVFYFLGFVALSMQAILEAEDKKKVVAGLIFAGNYIMAGWVLIGPFINRPFLGLAPFTLPL